ncbi:TetR/AcrR family transcriptional regulator [Anaerotignum sp.]|uniref:TetR/AcrR family transcriptional regulator n=1 Tax=Anaerotignum sp. TaxID=2039241 RepID=UPI0027155B0A|nr:TetR/AcrR family transcriptional regulator [Anaerotignum sp.]
MKKNITKEQIVVTALELMRNKSDLRGVNLREIARTLGCAHTNLYNYFPSYNDLLWETHATLQGIFMKMLLEKLEQANTPEMQLTYFFQACVEMYLDNKGWFRLAWHEYLEGDRPQADIETTEATNKMLNQHIAQIWKELYGQYPNADATKRVLHNTHSYIVGEISNYLLGRGWVENEPELKAYIVREAVSMFRLCLTGCD